MCQKNPGLGHKNLHCQCCVYLGALLKKLQKVAEIAYISSKAHSTKNSTLGKPNTSENWTAGLTVFEKILFGYIHALSPYQL